MINIKLNKDKKIGVALSGGGLKCVAHIGAIKALRELGINIDYISGTSSGSIIAASYAMGYNEEEMKELIKMYYKVLTKFDKRAILKGLKSFLMRGTVEIGGLIDGQKVENLIEGLCRYKKINSIEDMIVPFAAATVDTISTKECLFVPSNISINKRENIEYIINAPISKVVRASAAFPGIFTTCNMPPYNFMDGGTKDNLPVEVLKDMGAEQTIAIYFKLDDYKPTNDIFATMLRACDLFSQKDVEKAIKATDIAIEIDASETGLLDIGNMEESYKRGYDAVMSAFSEV